MAEPLDMRALLEGTTPGPWDMRYSPVGDVLVTIGKPAVTLAVLSDPPDDEGCHRGWSDARLIAAAPALAARVLELEAEREGAVWVNIGGRIAPTVDEARQERVMCLGEPTAVASVKAALAEMAELEAENERLRESLERAEAALLFTAAAFRVTDQEGADDG